MKKTKVIIKTNDPKEAEYLAKILINDATERKLRVVCHIKVGHLYFCKLSIEF